VLLAGKHDEKLTLARQRGTSTFRIDDTADARLPNARRADVVVECTGSARGLAMALQVIRPRGTLVLKSTVAERSSVDLAPIVIDEILVQGSRCGPFAPAIHALSQGRIDVKSLVTDRFPLEAGVAAFERAAQPGVLKVLLTV
jgi:threonine dehydrogenase-like Zn-dependent dehydrogenase